MFQQRKPTCNQVAFALASAAMLGDFALKWCLGRRVLYCADGVLERRSTFRFECSFVAGCVAAHHLRWRAS
eukprot:5389749-Lingulodinium_polyedra.AAC.1